MTLMLKILFLSVLCIYLYIVYVNPSVYYSCGRSVNKGTFEVFRCVIRNILLCCSETIKFYLFSRNGVVKYMIIYLALGSSIDTWWSLWYCIILIPLSGLFHDNIFKVFRACTVLWMIIDIWKICSDNPFSSFIGRFIQFCFVYGFMMVYVYLFTMELLTYLFKKDVKTKQCIELHSDSESSRAQPYQPVNMNHVLVGYYYLNEDCVLYYIERLDEELVQRYVLIGFYELILIIERYFPHVSSSSTLACAIMHRLYTMYRDNLRNCILYGGMRAMIANFIYEMNVELEVADNRYRERPSCLREQRDPNLRHIEVVLIRDRQQLASAPRFNVAGDNEIEKHCDFEHRVNAKRIDWKSDDKYGHLFKDNKQKDVCVSKKKKTASKLDKKYKFKDRLQERVFSEKSKSIYRQLIFEDVIKLLASYFNYKPDIHNQKENDVYVEFKRLTKNMIAQWKRFIADEIGDEVLCELEQYLLKTEEYYKSVKVTEVPRVVQHRCDQKYVFDAQINFPRVSSNHIGKVFENQMQRNVLWDNFDRMTGFYISVSKVKSCVKSMSREGKTYIDFETWLHHKCPLWKYNRALDIEIPSKKRKKNEDVIEFPKVKRGKPLDVQSIEIPYLTIAWCRHLIEPTWMSLEIKDMKAFKEAFASAMVECRNRILEFARNWFSLSVLSKDELRSVKKKRAKVFKTILQSPTCQLMYVQGYKHEEVCDFVNKNYKDKLMKAALESEELANNLKKTKTSTEKQILSLRTSVYDESEEIICVRQIDVKPLPKVVKPKKERVLVLDSEGWNVVLRKNKRSSDIQKEVLAEISSAIAGLLTQITIVLVLCVCLIQKVKTEAKTIVKKLPGQVWHVFMESIKKGEFNDKSKLLCVEVNAILQALYHVYKQNYTACIMSLTHLSITRSEVLFSLLTYDTFMKLSAFLNCAYVAKKLNDTFSFSSTKGHGPDGELQLEVYADNLSSVTEFVNKLFQLKLSQDDVRSANNTFQLLNNVKRTTSDLAHFMRVCTSTFCRFMLGVDPFDYTFRKRVGEMLGFNLKVSDLKTQSTHMQTDIVLINDVIKTYEMSKELSVVVTDLHLPHFLTYRFQRSCVEIENLAKEAYNFKNLIHHRKTPMCVMFTGKPHTGKTTSMDYIMRALCAKDKQQYSASMLYTKESSDDYWQGYEPYRQNKAGSWVGKKYVIFDDIFKSKVVDVRMRQSTTLIDLINTSPYSLNMADIDSKGSTYFDSPYVFLTTNAANDGIQSVGDWCVGLQDNAAFLRRIHLVLHKTEVWKGVPEIKDVEWRIDQCEIFPQYVGKSFPLAKIVLLVDKIKLEMHRRETLNHYTDAEYMSHLDGIQLEVLTEEPDRKMTPEELEEYVKNKAISKFAYEDGKVPTGLALTDTIIQECVEQTFVDVKKANTGFKEDVHDFVDWSIDEAKFFYEWSKLTLEAWGIRIDYAFYGTLVVGIPLLYYFFIHKYDNDANVNLDVSGGQRVYQKPQPMRQPKSKEKKMFRKIDVQRIQLHGGEDVFSRYQCGVFRIEMKGLGDMFFSGAGFHFRDGWVISCAHVVEHIAKYIGSITFRLSNGSIDVEFCPTQNDIVVASSMDMMALKVPFPQMPPALDRYVNSDTKVLPHQNIFIGVINKQRQYENVPCKVSPTDMFAPVTYSLFEECTIVVEKAYKYTSDSHKGYSGAPVVCYDGSGVKILGIHSGSHKVRGYGFAQVFFKQELDMMLEKAVELEVGVESIIRPNRTVSVPNYPPAESKITHSPFYGWMGRPNYIPAKMRPFKVNGETINPLQIGLAKLRQERFYVDIPKDLAMMYLQMRYPRSIIPPRVVSIDDAVTGVPGEFSSVCMSTSSGYMEGLPKGVHGKYPHLYNDLNGSIRISPEFKRIIEDKLASLKAGNNIPVLWAICLKDETRPYAKALAGKTRIFDTCPLDYLILMRMYFIDFVMFVQNQASRNLISVGLNVHGIEWQMIYHKLKTFSANGSIVAGDFGNYDTTIPVEAGELVCDYINWWYNGTEEDNMVRKLLFQHILRPEHVLFDYTFYTYGNPSGNPITSIYNSLVNIVIVFTALHKLGIPMDAWTMVCYGDDHVLAFSEHKVTVSMLRPVFKECLHMEYTHWSKEDVEDKLDDLHEIRYLGRKFSCGDRFIRAPLEMSVIHEMLYWRRKGDVSVIMTSTLRSFGLELSHHSREVFEYTLKELRSYMQRMDFDYFLEQLDKLIFPYEVYQYMMYEDGRSGTYMRALFGRDEDRFLNNAINSASIENVELEVFRTEQRHTEVTDRELIEATTSAPQELGSFKDEVPILHAEQGNEIMSEPHKGFNMETFTLDNVLDRVYQIGTTNWSSTAAIGTILAAVELPQSLFLQPFIAKKIQGFKGFKTAFKISVRLSSSRFNFGRLIMSYVPRPSKQYQIGTAPSIYTLCGFEHVDISAGSSDVVEMVIPFIYPARYCLFDDVADEPDLLGKVYISVMHPLQNIEGEAISIPVSVFLQMLNCELVIPITHASGGFDVIEKHSGRGKSAEQNRKAQTGSITDSNIVRQLIPGGVSHGSFTGDIVGKLATGMAGMAISTMMDKPTTADTQAIMKIDPYADLNTYSGIDTSIKITGDISARITNDTSIAGVHADEMSLRHIAMTPALVKIVTITNTSNSFLIGVLGEEETRNFRDFLRRLFTSTTGATNFMLMVSASQNISIRLVIWVDDGQDSVYEDCYHMFVDIQGDTIVKFSVPYMEAAFVKDSQSDWRVRGQVVAWSTPSASVSPTIYMSVYKAAGSDVKFYLPYDSVYQTNVSLEVDVRREFSSTFPPIHPSMRTYHQVNLIYGEEYTSVKQLITRYQALFTVAQPPYIWVGSGNYTSNTYIGMQILGLLFCLWRGSIRFKLVPQSSMGTHFVSVMNSQNEYNNALVSGLSFCTPVNRVLAIEVPYMGKLFEYTTDPEPFLVSLNVPLASTYMMQAAGDDFTFALLRLPPAGTWLSGRGDEYGILGLWKFLNEN